MDVADQSVRRDLSRSVETRTKDNGHFEHEGDRDRDRICPSSVERLYFPIYQIDRLVTHVALRPLLGDDEKCRMATRPRRNRMEAKN